MIITQSEPLLQPIRTQDESDLTNEWPHPELCEHSRCLAAICLIFIVSQFDDWIINVKITITKINFCNLLKPLAIQLKRCKDLKVKVMVSLAFHIASGQTGVVMAGSYE